MFNYPKMVIYDLLIYGIYFELELFNKVTKFEMYLNYSDKNLSYKLDGGRKLDMDSGGEV